MNINDHVICQLCSKPFSDPRILSCLHSFCCKCLLRVTEKLGSQKQNCFLCPTCLRSVSIPAGGARHLPQNLHLGYEVQVIGYMSKFSSDSGVPCTFCVNGCSSSAVAFCCVCHAFLCKAGQDCHRYVPQLLEHIVVGLDKESAAVLPTVMKPTEQYCSQPKHKKQELNFYCETCSCLVCRDCIVVVHKDHTITELSIIAESHRDEMKETLEDSNEVMSKLAYAADKANTMIQRVESSKQQIKLDVENAFSQLIKTLEERKKALLSELDAVSLSKVNSLTLQKDEFVNYQHDVHRYNDFTSHVLQTHVDHEVVALGRLVSSELKTNLKKATNVSLIPKQQSYLRFSAQIEGFTKELFRLGEIVDMNPSPQASTCTYTPVAKVNLKHYSKVETKTSKRERYCLGNLEVKAELRSKSHDGPIVPGEVEDHGDGTYTITLTPKTIGPHQLIVTMDGQHVQNSPYNVEVSRDYTSLCNPKQVISVAQPYCVAVHDKGDIYVGCNDECIHVFDKSGKLKHIIGGSGKGESAFDGPVGAFVKGDILYVADVGNHCIKMLTVGGKFLRSIGEQGSRQGQLNAPSDVVVDSKDRVIVADRDNSRVQVFSQGGDWMFTIDGNGSGDHAYKYPCSLVLDHQENIHVAAYGSDTIKVFTPEGIYLRMYGYVDGPRGIAIGHDGYSLVCDKCLSIFDPQGHKIHTIEDLQQPSGITVDPKSGSIYIVLFNNNNVLRYALEP
eukprot:Em0001g1816a